MDKDVEEGHPLPLPVDNRGSRQQDYLTQDFKDRNASLKRKLFIDGQVRIMSQSERE
jgi:hypothetical protein